MALSTQARIWAGVRSVSQHSPEMREETLVKTGSFCLTFVLLMLLCTSGKGDEKLTFEKVVVKKGVRSVDLLFVVLTEPKVTNDKLDELVLKYAAAALREATEHKFEG